MATTAAGQITPTFTVQHGRNDIDPGQLNEFVTSFNDFWSSDTALAFEKVDADEFAHLEIGAGLRAMLGPITLATNVTWGDGTADRSFRYTNRVGHDLDMRTKDITWDAQFGLVFRKRLMVSTIITAYYRDITYRLYTVFPDDSRSLGNVYKISGVYTGTTSSVEFGVGTGLFVGPVLLNIKWLRPTSFPPGQDLISLDDYDNDELPPTWLPADYPLWTTDPVAFAQADASGEEVGVLADRLKATRLVIGIEIGLFGR